MRQGRAIFPGRARLCTPKGCQILRSSRPRDMTAFCWERRLPAGISERAGKMPALPASRQAAAKTLPASSSVRNEIQKVRLGLCTPKGCQKIARGRSAAETPGWGHLVFTPWRGARSQRSRWPGLAPPQGADSLLLLPGVSATLQPPATICHPSGVKTPPPAHLLARPLKRFRPRLLYEIPKR